MNDFINWKRGEARNRLTAFEQSRLFWHRHVLLHNPGGNHPNLRKVHICSYPDTPPTRSKMAVHFTYQSQLIRATSSRNRSFTVVPISGTISLSQLKTAPQRMDLKSKAYNFARPSTVWSLVTLVTCVYVLLFFVRRQCVYLFSLSALLTWQSLVLQSPPPHYWQAGC